MTTVETRGNSLNLVKVQGGFCPGNQADHKPGDSRSFFKTSLSFSHSEAEPDKENQAPQQNTSQSCT